MGIRLEGKTLADKIKEGVRQEIDRARQDLGRVPGLIGVLVGENRASQIYLRTKEKTSQSLGIASQILTFPTDIGGPALKEQIEELNRREDVDGILVQLPLPTGYNAHEIISMISPEKDVDGLHPVSLGNLLSNQEGLRPCTPSGIVELLKYSCLGIEGKEVVIIGRSLLVGKPLAAMMTNENGTVTICHSKTTDLGKVAARADILVAAMGKAAFVQPEWVKEGAVVVDVGTNYVTDRALVENLFGKDEKREKDLKEKGYTLIGDVHPNAAGRASHMTPVPGGVGPLTVAMLMKNTLEAFKRLKRMGTCT